MSASARSVVTAASIHGLRVLCVAAVGIGVHAVNAPQSPHGAMAVIAASGIAAGVGLLLALAGMMGLEATFARTRDLEVPTFVVAALVALVAAAMHFRSHPPIDDGMTLLHHYGREDVLPAGPIEHMLAFTFFAWAATVAVAPLALGAEWSEKLPLTKRMLVGGACTVLACIVLATTLSNVYDRVTVKLAGYALAVVALAAFVAVRRVPSALMLGLVSFTASGLAFGTLASLDRWSSPGYSAGVIP